MRPSFPLSIVLFLASSLMACTADSADTESTTAEVRTDLWMSVLTQPPTAEEPALGVYVHCPSGGRTAVDLYEILPARRRSLGSFQTSVSRTGHTTALLAGTSGAPKFELDIDTSSSFSIAPFTYAARLTLDPGIYRPTEQQKHPTVMMLNPAHPDVADQPVWNTNLSSCGR